MRILEYSDLDTSGVEAQYRKLVEMLKRDDFYSAEVKKLGPGDYYRARLDHTNRLLFTLRRHNGERHALVLDVIRNHAYEKSRFLRGARIDEEKVPPVEQAPDTAVLPVLKFVNPATARFHFLDKAISFDGAQEAILGLPAPLIVIGSAGSGKTALTLERMKLVQGDVLYATLSPYLAQNARNLYYAHGYDNENQNIDFLSCRELLETFRVPTGREVTYGAFNSWFARHRQNYKFADAHKLFEEFHGVLTGAEIESPRLARDAYLALGVRQSIFPAEERPAVYDLFEKYLAFLDENGLYDSNLLAHRYFELCEPRYDFAVVDEVQDLTNVQLALVLRTLRNSGDFILCGDSNQIVHPNFFSWAKVKTLFYKDQWLEAKRVTHVLHTNYRNAEEITAVANRLLKLKQRRFGSIDRESNYLVESVTENRGEVQLLPDRDKLKRELDEKTRNSARFAVLVMRDEDKPAAREHFRTPLLFSIHEAKGLEYDNVILCNFVSNDRAAFSHIAGDVTAAELEQELAYARAKDKTDKSLEVYKFFVNAFYVAITRAVKNLYVIESDTAHALLRLIGLEATRERVDMTAQSSTREEWQREARRLELQGKEEQADAIRREILQVRPVPWTVLTRERYLELLDRALDRREISKKPRQQLLEYGAVLDDHSLFPRLASAGYEQATHGEKLAVGMRKKHLGEYESKNPKEVLRSAEAYGVDFRNPFNLTPLMCAAMQGNIVLAQALLDRGANPELTDNHGRTALHLVLLRAYTDSRFAATRLGDLYPLLTPASVSVRAQDRLIKIDGHTIEFFLFHSMVALFHRRISSQAFCYSGFATGDFVDSIQNFPENTLAGYRKRRQYLSGVLARNEVSRDYPYNRRLFVRLRQGYYALNPQLSLRVGEDWINIQQHLGRSLIEAHGEKSVCVFFARVDNAIARSGANCEALVPPSAGPTETEPAAPAGSASSRNQGDTPRQPLPGETRPAQLDLFGS